MPPHAAWTPHYRRGPKAAHAVRGTAIAEFADMLGFDLAVEDDAASLRSSIVSFLAHFAVGRVAPHPAMLATPVTPPEPATEAPEASLSGMVVAPQELFMQQLAALEEYSVTSAQLFDGIAEDDMVEVGGDDAGWAARLPRGAEEVVAGVTELTDGDGIVVRVPTEAALAPYIKVRTSAAAVSWLAFCG